MTDTIEILWRDYHDGLHAFIHSRIAVASDTEDILQEVFIRTFDQIGSLRDPTRIKSWMYQVARNAIIDHYRSRRPSDELPASLSTTDPEPTDKARQEIERCLLPMIENLPHDYKEAVMLSEIQGLSQKQVARHQGLSLSGAKSRIQRGRARIKKMLTECCRFDFDHRGVMMDFQVRKETNCTYC